MLFTFRTIAYLRAGKNRIFMDDIKVEIGKSRKSPGQGDAGTGDL